MRIDTTNSPINNAELSLSVLDYVWVLGQSGNRSPEVEREAFSEGLMLQLYTKNPTNNPD
jgi:hypothetical protein